jgi:multisubunit Na+/H+ antiporter MnhC subunit
MTIEVVLLVGAIGLIMLGLAGLFIHRNVFRMLLALVLLESGVNLLLILSGFYRSGVAPIFLAGQEAGQVMTDPIPQALVLTAIVIGVGVQALALALILRIKAHYNTLDMAEIRQQMEYDLATNIGVTSPASAHSPDALVHSKVVYEHENMHEQSNKQACKKIGEAANG